MQRRYNLVYFALGLTLLMIGVDAQAQIAFVSDRRGPGRDIYAMNANGRNPRRLTNHQRDDQHPSWSPDGGRIVFASSRNGNREIYVMDTDGQNLQNLTNNPGADTHPSWSPDGEHIAFASSRGNNHWWETDIYVMDADGQNLQNLTNNPGADTHPSWSPDGERIALVSDRDGNSEIYVMNANGQNLRRLTNNPGDDHQPSWSPDGERIAFMSNRNEENVGLIGNWEIYVMDADGQNLQNLTNNPGDDRHPSWSPDGERIAFASDRNRILTFDIYVMDADGQNLQNLTETFFGYDSQPAWFRPILPVAPAGRTLTMWGWLKQVVR